MPGGYFNDDQNDKMKQALYPYLMDKARRRAAQTSSGAYAAREKGYRTDEEMADRRGLVSVLGDSASMAGTLQGKRSDVGLLPKYMDQLGANDQQRTDNLFKERGAEEASMGTDIRIADFVGDMDNKDKDRKAKLQGYLEAAKAKREADALSADRFNKTYDQRDRLAKESSRLREKQIDKPAGGSTLRESQYQGPDGSPLVFDPRKGSYSQPQVPAGAKRFVKPQAPGAAAGPGGIIPGYVDADGNPLTYNPKTGAQGSLQLPPGAKATKTPEAQKMSEDEAKRGLSARIAIQELKTLEDMEKTYRPGGRSVAAGMAGKVFGENAENVLKSEDDQRYDAANARIVDPFLRATTGAGYTHEEIVNKLRGYTIRPGDTERTIKEKQGARREFVHGILDSARKGGAGQTMPDLSAEGGPNRESATGQKTKGPPVGTIKVFRGQKHQYNGGDPNDQTSWPVVQGGG